MILPRRASVHEHGGRPCPGGRNNRDTAEFVYYMAHMENAARILNWGLFANYWAVNLPERKVVADQSIMSRYGRREHRKFVNLYFGTHTAMQHTITRGKHSPMSEEDLVFLRFDADDLFQFEGAKFSDGNVASDNSKVFSAEEDSEELKNLIWSIILCQKKYNKSKSAKRTKMAELLIPNYIPPSHIHSVVVLNSESEDKLCSLIKTDASEEYLEALRNIRDDSDFDSPSGEDDIALEPNHEVDIIRDGGRRHFYRYGDGDGGYQVPSIDFGDVVYDLFDNLKGGEEE